MLFTSGLTRATHAQLARDSSSAPAPAPSPIVASAALEGVSLEYHGRQVLADLTLHVAPGEALCLVGPSGGGKSTILNLLAGLVTPTKGRVVFDGEPVVGPSPDRAVVFQDAALFPWLTLEKNIAFPLEIAKVDRKERNERVEELLRLVHLVRFRDAYPHELSGGMRQRGAIARALASRPRMILFDEPFAALDGQMRALLQGEVERIVRASRTTMVFVTHQIDEAVRLGDRVVLIGARPGRVIGEVHVDLGRPRKTMNEDFQALRLAQRIAEIVREEVENVAREEALDVEDESSPWSRNAARGEDVGGTRRRRGHAVDPRRDLGRGI